jgi:PAS domain S-box-containing protein
MRERPRARLVAFGLAVLATAGCLFIRWPLWPLLKDAVPHLTFFPAVMIAAYFGGLWPGLLATALSGVAANYFLTHHLSSPQGWTVNDAAALILFVLVGTITSGLCESLHRAQARILAGERRRAEEALSQERCLVHALMDNIPDSIYFKDASSRFLRINRALATSFGLSDPAQATGKTDFDFFAEEHAGPALRDEQEILRTGRPLVGKEERETWLQGRVSWVSTTKMPLRDRDGKIIGTFGVARDITKAKLAEEALRESEERFRGTFENAAVGIVHTDVEGRFVRLNQRFCDIVGYPRDELLGRNFRDITHPDDLAASIEPFTALMRGESLDFGLEKRYLRKDGSLVWVEVFVSLQRDTAGKAAYAIGVFQEISERKRLEAEARQARETAESANRAKDEFLANVSHEIRTPMNAILGMTELVLDTPVTDDQRQSLRTVKSAADNLLGIINALLDFSKIAAGKLELDPADFSLRAGLADTMRALAVRAHKKGLELITDVHPDVPDRLVGDAGRLRQVLLNLVGNAIKFTDRGEVVLEVKSDECRGTSKQRVPEATRHSPLVTLHFSIRDTGIGIARENQERIFQAFEQDDTSTTRKYGGTGLGLTIASRLVGLMGGEITVASEPGRGSTFAFTARFGRQPHQPAPDAVQPPVLLRGLPVLIVDDNATNRHILESWLRRWQMKPAAVGDGLGALDALWHGTACGRPYGLVVLDARMPDVDGLTLAAQIRQRGELSATPIILLTSGDHPGDLARSRELRVDAHLLKPVQPDELLETFHRVMRRSKCNAAPEREPSPLPAEAAAGGALRILVAEDNEFNAQLLVQLLGRRGHRVRVANNGREALALAEEGDFDLLLLDVHMPELDGFQVVQAIRQQESGAGRHLPVIALTARARKEDRERCLAAGMDDFMSKPIQAAELWAAIERVVGTRPPVVRPGPGLLAPRVLLAACGGDQAILERICHALRARLPHHLTAVQEALSVRDAPRLREAAHKVSGMVAAFSTVAGGVASDLEDLAADGRLDEAAPLVERLDTMGRELMRLVDGLTLESLQSQDKVADLNRTTSR